VEGDAVTWEAGMITAVKLGTARLSWGEQVLIVTVCETGLQVSLPEEPLFVGPGSTAQLQPALNHPADPGQLSYSVTDDTILQVAPDGTLTGLAEGTATVIATLPSGFSAAQEVTVIQLLESVAVEDDYIKLRPGTQKPVVAVKAPAESPEKLVWTSSDPAIATVDENGMVTGVSYGTVTVTCTSQYGNIAAACKVKVCDLIQVALTYDDGPSSTYTPMVLDMLKENGITATFFLVGNRIKTTPESVKRMAEEGHEIGYHTWSHTFFFNMTEKQIADDFAQFQAAVYEASGKQATVYRAPGGNITNTALQTIPLPHINWSVDTRDWATRNTEAVKNAVINGLKDGAIILVHDIHATTYYGTKEAIEYIIKKDLDVEFLTVTELLSRNGTPPEPGRTYYKS
jgi:peptidoglycan/xylan/chitin deacetylase (PgdA/CDA1 family)